MNFLDLTFPGPASNLAQDDAMLDQCDAAGRDGEEVLRLWEPEDYFVVLGYANRADSEVDLAACAEKNIPVFRRCSGGGTVLLGPGCLNYSLCLRIDESETATVTGANRKVMERHRQLFQKALSREIRIQGHTDLTADDLKFSGNAQRRRRSFLLFHGTFLLGMNLAAMSGILKMPGQQPGYRRGRPHQDFLTNAEVPADEVRSLLQQHWQASTRLMNPPEVGNLVTTKYSRDDWNRKF